MDNLFSLREKRGLGLAKNRFKKVLIDQLDMVPISVVDPDP